ncbi:hypothetical protein ACIHCQ_43900 [Streptomyces sp. NPDC052236]|uniref:hypothetical protein n=1 Tax=Streptomyces sp. NPDC052236 TaxID=3365686 RepID=UPI0037D3B705
MRRHLIIGAALAAALVPAVPATADSLSAMTARPVYSGCGYHPSTTVHLRSSASTRSTSLELLASTLLTSDNAPHVIPTGNQLTCTITKNVSARPASLSPPETRPTSR